MIPSSADYWDLLAEKSVFLGKEGDQLKSQMEVLLDRLFVISTEIETPPFLPNPEFTPLQNVCLYVLMFGIWFEPLGSFRPLDTAKISRAFRDLRIPFGESQRNYRLRDVWLRTVLPINCPVESIVRKQLSHIEHGLILRRRFRKP